MEHEVGIALPGHIVRRALREPSVFVRCLPGLVVDQPPVGDTVSGRLRLRVGGSSITYRGLLRVAGQEGDATILTVDAEQAVGTGSLAGTIRAEVLPAGPAAPEGGEAGADSAGSGSRVLFLTALDAKGRIEDLSPEAVRSAARRLLDRFCAGVAADPGARSLIGEQAAGPQDDPDAAEAAGGVAADADETPGGITEAIDPADADAGGDADAAADVDETGELGEESVPPQAPGVDDVLGSPDDDDLEADGLDADRLDADGLDSDDLDAVDPADEALSESDFDLDLDLESEELLGTGSGAGAEEDALQPVPEFLSESDEAEGAESAPYRRSILGPSAEEVDHAPPRGRYAPSLPTRSARSRAATRWGGGQDQRMGEPPVATPDRARASWVVGGAALVGGAVLLARRLRRN